MGRGRAGGGGIGMCRGRGVVRGLGGGGKGWTGGWRGRVVIGDVGFVAEDAWRE